jgi:hypothetical protein
MIAVCTAISVDDSVESPTLMHISESCPVLQICARLRAKETSMHDKLAEIQARWPRADAFYAERDHRTQLEVNNLHQYVHTPIEIRIAPEFAEDLTVQRIALVAANLTARWARNVRVFVPRVQLATALRVHNDERLDLRIKREMSEGDPFGHFDVGEITESSAAGLRLNIGPFSAYPLSNADYVVDATGWTALGRRGGSAQDYRRDLATAPAAALAAAIGAADLFKRAIGHPTNEWIGQIKWCTWHHKLHSDVLHCAPATVSQTAELGDLLIAGVGAVGSALLYVLSLMPLQGHVTVLDRDVVEASNLNRSPLFTALNAAQSRTKTDVAGGLLRSLGIHVEAVQGAWRDNSERLAESGFDAWVSLTNEDGAWAEVPFQLPPIVLHGTTTSGWGIGFGRHIPRVEDCTACRLPRPHAEFRGPCAEGQINSSDLQEPVTASLPFLSTASAALIATELLKLNFPSASSLPNAVYADFRFGLPAVVATLIRRSVDCRGCQVANLPLWSKRGGLSRYASFSATDR